MIKFYNIRSGETAVAENEPHIAALWASSDHSPNITQGQDFGWRLAPEIVVEMKLFKQDMVKLTQLAARIGKPLEDIGEPDILMAISAKYDAEQAPVANTDDYQDTYDAEVRRRMREVETAAPVNSASSAPVESLEDLQKRVELEERLAAARAVAQPSLEPELTTTTTTAAPEVTTTTTTEQPTVTTTTTVPENS